MKKNISKGVIFGIISFVIGVVADYFEDKKNEEYIREQINEALDARGMRKEFDDCGQH